MAMLEDGRFQIQGLPAFRHPKRGFKGKNGGKNAILLHDCGLLAWSDPKAPTSIFLRKLKLIYRKNLDGLNLYLLQNMARLNLIEMFFSKIARSFLRYIRVESKEELVRRIYQGIDEINQEPVVFRWHYKMDEVAPA